MYWIILIEFLHLLLVVSFIQRSLEPFQVIITNGQHSVLVLMVIMLEQQPPPPRNNGGMRCHSDEQTVSISEQAFLQTIARMMRVSME